MNTSKPKSYLIKGRISGLIDALISARRRGPSKFLMMFWNLSFVLVTIPHRFFVLYNFVEENFLKFGLETCLNTTFSSIFPNCEDFSPFIK